MKINATENVKKTLEKNLADATEELNRLRNTKVILLL